jgi:hypothetical protein
LKPVSGFEWVFDIGPTWLAATNPKAPSATDHYRQITYAPLTEKDLAELRKALALLGPAPAILQRDVLRFNLLTSWGAEKQIFLLPPGKEDAGNVLGFECVNGCHDLKRDAWFFAVRPLARQ